MLFRSVSQSRYVAPVDDYKELADYIKENEVFPKEYSDKLSEAMMIWANLFKEE